jgi:pilus assembly protein CpaD
MSLNRFIIMTVTRTLLVAAAFSLAALCLAACVASPRDNPARGALNPGALYPLRADPASDQIALALHAEGLSPAQVQALRALADRRRDTVGGPLLLNAPRSADAALVARMQIAARAVLMAQGVADGDIAVAAYDAPGPAAPLLVSYAYLKADIPRCGKKWDELTHTEDNRVQSNFGCAETANMAAQIANPNDIVHPQAEQAPDLQRRLTVLGKYQAGKVTAADEPDAKSGIVSRVAP